MNLTIFIEIGRKIERQQIRQRIIRREFPGFTFDNERPEGFEARAV